MGEKGEVRSDQLDLDGISIQIICSVPDLCCTANQSWPGNGASVTGRLKVSRVVKVETAALIKLINSSQPSS